MKRDQRNSHTKKQAALRTPGEVGEKLLLLTTELERFIEEKNGTLRTSVLPNLLLVRPEADESESGGKNCLQKEQRQPL